MHFELSRERAARLKVWILIPAAMDHIHATFATCLIRLLGTLRVYGINYELRFQPNDSLVTRARNNLADVFYTGSSDDNNHFSLWLDEDILFDPDSVLQMLSLDLDFVAAPYTKKGLHMDRMKAAAQLNWPSERLTSVAGSPNVNWLVHPIQLDRPMPVLEAGTGFWLVKRKVFRLMAEGLNIRYKRCPEETNSYGSDHAHDFFRVGVWPETREYLSEDWWFSREWRNLGGTVWCCFWIKTTHIGQYMYPMDMQAISDLLTATGGYITGPTWAEDKEHEQKGRSAQPGSATEAVGAGHSAVGEETRRRNGGDAVGAGGKIYSIRHRAPTSRAAD